METTNGLQSPNLQNTTADPLVGLNLTKLTLRRQDRVASFIVDKSDLFEKCLLVDKHRQAGLPGTAEAADICIAKMNGNNDNEKVTVVTNNDVELLGEMVDKINADLTKNVRVLTIEEKEHMALYGCVPDEVSDKDEFETERIVCQQLSISCRAPLTSTAELAKERKKAFENLPMEIRVALTSADGTTNMLRYVLQTAHSLDELEILCDFLIKYKYFPDYLIKREKRGRVQGIIDGANKRQAKLEVFYSKPSKKLNPVEYLFEKESKGSRTSYKANYEVKANTIETVENNFFKVPMKLDMKGKYVPKPNARQYSVLHFRSWLEVEAWKVFKPDMPRNYGVMANGCAKILYEGSPNMTRPYILTMLVGVSIWFGNFNDVATAQPSKVRIQDYLNLEDGSIKPLFIGDVPINSIKELEKFKFLFLKDKSMYNKISNYLNETQIVNPVELQNFIDRVIVPKKLRHDDELKAVLSEDVHFQFREKDFPAYTCVTNVVHEGKTIRVNFDPDKNYEEWLKDPDDSLFTTKVKQFGGGLGAGQELRELKMIKPTQPVMKIPRLTSSLKYELDLGNVKLSDLAQDMTKAFEKQGKFVIDWDPLEVFSKKAKPIDETFGLEEEKVEELPKELPPIYMKDGIRSFSYINTVPEANVIKADDEMDEYTKKRYPFEWAEFHKIAENYREKIRNRTWFDTYRHMAYDNVYQGIRGGIDRYALFYRFVKTAFAKHNDDIEFDTAMLDFASFLGICWTATSWIQVGMACELYVTRFPSVRFLLKDLQNKVFMQKQAEGDESKEGKSIFEMSFSEFFSSEGAQEIWRLITQTAGFILLAQTLAIKDTMFGVFSGFIKNVANSMTKIAATNVAEYLIGFCNSLMLKIRECIRLRSFSPFLTPELDPKTWLHEVGACCMYSQDVILNPTSIVEKNRMKKLREEGRIPSHWVEPFTPEEYEAFIADLLDRGEKIKSVVAGDFQAVRHVQETINFLKAYLEGCSNAKNIMATRIQPLGLFITGPTSAGKSVFVKDLLLSISRARGYNNDDSSYFFYQMGNNFQDGLTFRQWAIIFDDIDTSPTPAVRGQEDHATLCMKWINTTPIPVEQARVEMKGTIAARPIVVIATSNYANMKLSGVTMQPGAIFRRYGVYVKFAAKPEYSKGEGALDPLLAANCRDGELHNIFVSEYSEKCVDNRNPFKLPYTPGVLMTRSKFFKYIIDKLDRHIKGQQLVLQRSIDTGMYCDDCFATIDSMYCGCSCKKISYEEEKQILCPIDTPINVFVEEHKDIVSGKTLPRSDATLPLAPGLIQPTPITAWVQGEVAPKMVKSIEDNVPRLLFASEESRSKYIAALERAEQPLPQYTAVLEVKNLEVVLEEKSETLAPDEVALKSLVETVMEQQAGFTVNVGGFLFQLFAYPWLLFLDFLVSLKKLSSWMHMAKKVNAAFKRGLECIPPINWKIVYGSILALCSIAMIWHRDKIRKAQSIQLQGRVDNGNGRVPQDKWVRPEQNYNPALPIQLKNTYTKEYLENLILKCLIRVRNTKTNLGMSALVIAAETILFPYHLIAGYQNFILDMIQNESVTSSITITESNVYILPGKDLCVVRVPHLKAQQSIVKFIWAGVDSSVSTFEDCTFVNGTKKIVSPNSTMQIYNNNPIVASKILTVQGDCGAVYFAKFSHGYKIIALHQGFLASKLNPGEGQATGELFSQYDIREAIKNVGCMEVGVIIPQGQTGLNWEKQTFAHYPKKSEVFTAVHYHGAQIFPIGTAEIRVHGTTMKSRVHPPLCAGEFEGLEGLICDRTDFWQKPEFKGAMVDGKWVSAYSNSLIHVQRVPCDEDVLILSLMDYLSGLEELDNCGYRDLSCEEALMGIPGTTLNKVNFNTSVGMPFNEKKSNHMFVKDDEIFVNPDIISIYNEFSTILNEGDNTPAPVMLWMLKDEPVKYSKNEKHDVRVFNCLPATFNMHLRQVFAPIETFMRDNKEFFECSIGINMTSSEATNFAFDLLSMNPKESRKIMEGDFKKIDKSYNGYQYMVVARFFFAVAQHLGTSPERIFKLFIAMKNGVHIINNDFFQLAAVNPSGNAATAHMNSVSNCISNRYDYYRQKYPKGLPVDLLEFVRAWARNFFVSKTVVLDLVPIKKFLNFRLDNRLKTYGDDFLRSLSKDCLNWYDCKKAPAIFKELGYTITDGQKRDVMELHSLEEVCFLKRHFVYDSRSQKFMVPLDAKTIIKMLRMVNESALSKADHQATLFADVLRESFYHGEDFFNMIRDRVLEAAEKFNLLDNGYFSRYNKDYDYFYNLFVQGSFQTWTDYQNPDLVDVTDAFTIYNQSGIVSMSSSSNNENGGSNSQSNEIVSTPLATISVTTDTDMVGETSQKPQNKLFQPRLDDFLSRPTFLQTITMQATDAPLSFISYIDPWIGFLANAAVAKKFANYYAIRGSIEVTFVVTAPAGAYGLYVLTCVPQMGTTDATCNSVAGTMPIQAALQPMYAMIDLSKSNNVVLTLPYLNIEDYSVLPTGPAAAWTIAYSCWTPISNSVTSGTITATMNVYARTLADLELVIPIDQAGEMSSFGDMQASFNKKIMSISGMKLSGMASAAAAAAERMGEVVPIFKPFAVPFAMGSAIAGKVMDIFGFTRESNPQPPMPMVLRAFSNVANVDAPDTSEIAALSVANSLSFDPRLSGEPTGLDTSAFAHLFPRYTLVTSAAWNSTQTSATNLITIPVTPFYCIGNVATGLFLTVAGYIGLPFAFWRGGMMYFIYIPISVFHRGSLQISWSPVNATSANVTNTLHNKILDVTVGHCWEVEVGYTSVHPALDSTIIPSTFTGPYLGKPANGFLRIDVATPLTCAVESAATTVYVFAAAASDMKFGVPKNIELVPNASGLTFSGTEFNYAYYQQAGALGDDAGDECEKFVLVPPSLGYPLTATLFGEDFSSVRTLMQKFSQRQTISNFSLIGTIGSPDQFLLVDHIPIPIQSLSSAAMMPYGNPSIGSGLFSEFNYVGYYRPLFVSIAGSTRYKIVNACSLAGFPLCAYGGAAAYTIPAGLGYSSLTTATYATPNMCPTQPMRQGDGVEVTVPWYSNERCQRARDFTKTTAANYAINLRQDMIVIGPNQRISTATGWLPAFEFYTAAGPDLRLGRFRFVPVLIQNSSNYPQVTFPWVNPSLY